MSAPANVDTACRRARQIPLRSGPGPISTTNSHSPVFGFFFGATDAARLVGSEAGWVISTSLLEESAARH